MNLITEQIKNMVGKTYKYENETLLISGYKTGLGKKGEDIELYFGNGETKLLPFGDMKIELAKFKLIVNSTQVIIPKSEVSISTVNNDILTQLRNNVLDCISRCKKDKSFIPQAKQIFNGVNSLLNIAKTEIEMRKYLNER